MQWPHGAALLWLRAALHHCRPNRPGSSRWLTTGKAPLLPAPPLAQVDRGALLEPLGVTPKEFLEVQASMAELCPDLVGAAAKAKKKGAGAQGSRELLGDTG